MVRSFIKSFNFGCFGQAEANVNWSAIPVNERLQERTRSWFRKLRRVTDNNIHGTGDAYQYGGVTQWSIDGTVSRVAETGVDFRRLGRWVWTRYRGRDGAYMRVVTAYRPNINKHDIGSVWNQQTTYFHGLSPPIIECPREVFDRELQELMATWVADGEHVILGIDANEDVSKNGEGSFSWKMKRLGLIEAITDKHGRGPSTYARGSKPIDGLYVTEGLRGLQCGYSEMLTDHRVLWMKVPYQVAYRYRIPPIPRPFARRLHCSDPRLVHKFNRRYKEICTKEDVFRRTELLFEQAKSGMTDALKEEYEELDRIKLYGCLQAERECRKLKMGEVPWSPTFAKARQKRSFLVKLVKFLDPRTRGRTKWSTVESAAKVAAMGYALRWDLPRAVREKEKMFEQYKEVKKKGAVLRESHLLDLATAAAAKAEVTVQKAILDIQKREETRAEWRQISFALERGGKAAGGVSMVQVVDNDGTVRDVTEQSEMERAISDSVHARNRQASDTPFNCGQLFQDVGPLGISEAAKRILDGSYDIPADVDDITKKYIPLLRKEAATPLMSLDLDQEDYNRCWKDAREGTAAGPSGLHFGHMKAAVQDPELARFHVLMEHIPYVTGYSPKRWQSCVDAMIEKKPGVYLVERLRAIVLFECDANNVFKKLGRDMMKTAEELKLLADEQFGSRKHKSAVEQCFNKRLTYDISRQLRKPMALISNDAKSCYDRIVHAIASLSMQRVGVPTEPIVCMFTTIQQMKHYVRTVYGEAKQYFGGEQAKLFAVPIQGVGQGNGAGPQIWAIVSTPVLQLLRREGFNVFFKFAISDESISFVAYAYVDDADNIVNCIEEEATYYDVLDKMQSSMDHWEGGIRATGGAIAPEKSFWYLVDFVWKNDKWHYASDKEAPGEITVLDTERRRQTLTRLKPSEARQPLGVFVAPDGNEGTQTEVMRSASCQWGGEATMWAAPTAPGGVEIVIRKFLC